MIEFLVIGATLSAAAWLAGAQVHRRSVASRALDRYAQSRGLLFVPAPSAKSSPRVVGTRDDDTIELTIDFYRLGDEVRTRVSMPIARGRAPSTQGQNLLLSVSQRGAFAWKTAPRLHLGDEAFDASWEVTTGTTEDAEALRSAMRHLHTLDQRQGVWLRSDGLKVLISWRGLESDPVILDAARETVLLVGSWHRPDSAYR